LKDGDHFNAGILANLKSQNPHISPKKELLTFFQNYNALATIQKFRGKALLERKCYFKTEKCKLLRPKDRPACEMNSGVKNALNTLDPVI
jgi:hypothetical protein